MLKVHNLVKTYRIAKSKETVRALDNVSIEFPETGLVFLLGKSGSGKSTLLNAIGGLDTFDSGEIIIKGKSSRDFSQADFDSYRNTFIGFIFQEYNILEEFTVAKNLSIALELQGKHADKEEVHKLLEQVDMLEYAKRKPNQLSGGQKQRVAIARALIKNPEIIMADEPTGALDSNTGKQVMDTLKKLSQTKLVIIVSHDREFAEIYGDRIIELKDGRIIRDVTKKEVEPEKTPSGIGFIDNKIIHIKKGTQLTGEDLRNINEAISQKAFSTDILISIDSESNAQVKKANFITDEGNKEVFCNTEPEDIKAKNYNPKDFKLIKSSLKFKDSLKMGASALKSKVFKLVFTIFLSFIAFTMFGVIDTFSSFNRAEGVYDTIVSSNTKHIALKKEGKGKYSNYNTPVTDADLTLFREKFPDINIDVVANRGLNFGSSYSSPYLYISGLDINGSNNVYSLRTSGMIAIDNDKLARLGFELIGDLPANNNEICISRHMFECLKYNNPNDVFAYEDVLNTYNKLDFNMNDTQKQYTIVGIIDDKTDVSKYTNMSTEELNSNFNLYYEIESVFQFGYTNMLYISQAEYDKYIDQGIQYSLNTMATENSYSSADIGRNITTFDDYYYTYHEPYMFNDFNNCFTFCNSSQAQAITSINEYYQLADDEVILDYGYIYNICADTVTNLPESTVLNGNYVIQIDNGYTQREFKIVGTCNGLSNNIIISANALKDFYVEDAQYHVQAKIDGVYSNVSVYPTHSSNLNTIKGIFLDRYPFSVKFIYAKDEVNPTIETVKPLSGINAYVSKDYVSSLGNEEELIDRINAGTLKLPFVKDTYNNDDNILVTLNVIGLLDNYGKIIVSDALYKDTFKPFTQGYDYILATISDNAKTNKDFIKYCETYRDDDTVFRVQNSSTGILDNFGDIFNTLTEVFLYMGIAFAVFASLLLMNFISTSISYKKREIGILRALGARGVDVFGIFFKESFIIALINFALATIATIVVTIIINILITTKLGIDLVLLSVGIRQIALIFGISTLAAFIASFLPTIRISKKKPIDAINNR